MNTIVKIYATSFTRPADTTAYASGDLVANSTTAGSVAPLTFTKDVNVGSLFIRRAKIIKSGTGVTNASFRLHLFSFTPTFAAGDNAALNVSGVANYLGAFDVTVDRAFADGSAGIGVPVLGSEISVQSEASSLYGFLEARGAYTPASAEVFTVHLEAHRY